MLRRYVTVLQRYKVMQSLGSLGVGQLLLLARRLPVAVFMRGLNAGGLADGSRL